MKVALYMMMSVNGYIARENGETDFASEVEWEAYKGKIQEFGNVIIGHRTYELMQESGESYANTADLVVVSHSKEGVEVGEKVFHAATPEDALRILTERGHERVLVGGGAKLNGSFMEKGLVDELFLDVEPFVVGQGMKLFGDAKFEAKLALVDTTMLSENEIQLHYKIQK